MLPDSFAKSLTDRVLVVDDSPTNRKLLRAILSNGGYEVDELNDGVECLEYCAKELPSMILLDVMMPNVGGLEACRKLREQHSKADLPIIMVTTLAENAGLAESLAAGANDYVVKPIDRSILMARIENQIALGRAQRRIEQQAKILEESLRIQSAMGDVLPEAMLVHDERGTILYSNKTCHTFCGEKSEIEIGKLFHSIFGGKFSRELEEIYAQISAIPMLDVFHELVDTRAPFREVQLISKPIAIESGQLRLWAWRDTSGTRALERAVSQRVKLETVSLFAAGVAHNFNNFMGAILGASDVLERAGTSDERARRCLGVIKRAVDSGMRLTRKMNAVYHKDLSSGDTADNDVAVVLDRIIGCYSLTLDGRIHFALDTPSDLPLLAAPGRVLVEIFGNILSNSIESISNGGNVSVAASYRESEKCVTVVVKDSGCGMSDETLGRIYEPFYSTKNFDQHSGVAVEGRGLGMWNTYNLLQACGGSIRVESELSQGTTIEMSFPVVL